MSYKVDRRLYNYLILVHVAQCLVYKSDEFL